MADKLQIRLTDPTRLISHLAQHFLNKQCCIHQSNTPLTCILYDILRKLGYDVTIVHGYLCIEPYPCTIIAVPNSFVECKYDGKIHSLDLQFLFQLKCKNPSCIYQDPQHSIYTPFIKRANYGKKQNIYISRVQATLKQSKLDALVILFKLNIYYEDNFYYKLSSLLLREAILFTTY